MSSDNPRLHGQAERRVGPYPLGQIPKRKRWTAPGYLPACPDDSQNVGVGFYSLCCHKALLEDGEMTGPLVDAESIHVTFRVPRGVNDVIGFVLRCTWGSPS